MDGSAITVRVPATSANLGPGFDCLALALDLWNEVRFEPGGSGLRVDITGEGQDFLPRDERNLIFRAFLHACRKLGLSAPPGLTLTCTNRIPLGSGLGSSAAAGVAGILGVRALLGHALPPADLLNLSAELEGHADNAAAALLGGLTLVSGEDQHWVQRKIELPAWQAAVVVPTFRLPTHQARAALPRRVSLPDAVFNIGRATLVVEALRSADENLLRTALQDRLHQPHRLKLIPGAEAALSAAARFGPAALSGAGPGMILFGMDTAVLEDAAQAMRNAFESAGLPARAWVLPVSNRGALEG